ncbi:MAG: transglutaminase-like domain-containing protein [Candidatus Zixiibacteriota bacterium]
MFHKILALIFLCLLVLTLSAAPALTGTGEFPPSVMKALEASGNNRPELEKAFTHYQQRSDSSEIDRLKYMAVQYLIENMEGHCYVTYKLVDTAGEEVDFNVLDYPDYDSLERAVGAIEDARGVLDYKRKDKFDDLQTITADFLMNQIDYAFRAWTEKPWAQNLTFEQFCDYVLPYRGSNEPLEPWREYFWSRYEGIVDSMSDPTDIVEAARIINDDVRSWFGFDPRYYYHPTDQGLSEMLGSELGRCEDMTNVTIYAFRANGLAVTSDYTPYWANSGNNHAWNAILLADGRVVPFMGAEANPGEYKLANKLAKVYRKMYALQPDNLIFQTRKQEEVPRWLAGKNYIDVTPDYTEVFDVSLSFTEELPDSVDMAYLCVFNSGEWQAIHWGRIFDGTAVFTDVGSDIVYLPALYLNEEIEPFGPPFVLEKNTGKVITLEASGLNSMVKLTGTTQRKQEISTDGVAKSSLADGKEYEFFVWQDGWQSLGTATAGDEPLGFENVPQGGLYWLVADDSDREERIFTIDDSIQVWW